MITTVLGHYPKIPTGPGANVRTAISRMDQGRITAQELEATFDEATKEAIQEQVEAGVDLVTDGQIRWEDGQTYFARRLRGFAINGLLRYFDTNTYFRQPVPEGKVTWQGPISVRDWQFAQEHSSKPVKAVITGPYTLARLSQLGSYGDVRSLALDLAEALRQEAAALQEAGATFIQFDEPAIVQAKWKADLPLLEEVSGIVTRGLSVTTAIATWFRDATGLTPGLFRLPFKVIGLDFVAGPATYDLLKDFPADKALMAGIVDARNTKMETVEQIVESVRRLTAHVSSDRLYINPSAGLEYLPRQTARAKLQRLVEGARKAQEVQVA